MRDIAPTGVRLPTELRDALLRESVLNGRSLSQEITVRLRESLEHLAAAQGPGAPHAKERPPSYGAKHPELTDTQRMLLAVFDALAPDKQLALLSLLRR